MEIEHVTTNGTPPARRTDAISRGEPEAPSVDRLALAGELVVAVAHDLRQPLAAIELNVSAAIQFLRRDDVAIEAALTALEAALDEEHRMRDSVQILQDLATRREPRREASDLTVALLQALALLRTDASARGVTIDVDAPANLPQVFGDLALMRQAFVSLLVGAVDRLAAAPAPDRTIRVTARPATNGIEVVTSHPNHLDDVAAEWQLAVVRTVVEAHEGTLGVDETPDGVRITTWWPLRAR